MSAPIAPDGGGAEAKSIQAAPSTRPPKLDTAAVHPVNGASKLLSPAAQINGASPSIAMISPKKRQRRKSNSTSLLTYLDELADQRFEQGINRNTMTRKQRISRFLHPHLKMDPTGHNILRYNVKDLFTWAFLQVFSGTAISRRTVILGCIMTGCATVIGYFHCDVERSDWKQQPNEGSWTICIPLTNPEALMFTSIAAFLLSFFVNITFSRWWSCRTLLQGLIGRSNNLTLLITSYIVGDDEETVQARETLIRYLNLAHVLLNKQASTEPAVLSPEKQAEIYGELLEGPDPLVTQEEWDLLQDLPGKWQIVYSWVSSLLRECALTGRLAAWQAMLPILQGDVTVMRGSAADIFMVINTQVPFAYSHLVTLVTKIHLLFVTLYAASVLAVGFHLRAAERLVMGFFIIWFNQFVYESLLGIHEELDNPFGFDYQDFPKVDYIARLKAMTKAQVAQATRMPASVARVRSVPVRNGARPNDDAMAASAFHAVLGGAGGGSAPEPPRPRSGAGAAGDAVRQPVSFQQESFR